MKESTIIKRIRENQFVLIAEVGVNYYDIAKKLGISDMEAAKLMVEEAAKAGIHAVKFQTYKAGTLAAKASPYYWDITEEPTRSQYELFQKFDRFGYEEYKEISEYCNEIGIEFFSTPFDFESADYLDELMDVYKISSSDLSNLPFIEHQAKKNKPILLSTGASELSEIEAAVAAIRKHNEKEIVLMHCVLEYPTPYEDVNLNKIVSLKEKFPEFYIGYSDHTKPTPECDVIKTAYNLGAVCVEKHYTLDKTLKGNDHYHGMDPEDAKRILSGIDKINMLRGNGEIRCLDTELTARKNARRSIVSNVDIKAGAVVTENMLTFKRPGTGISPAKIDWVIGKTAVSDIAEDTILTEEMFR
ncbi:acetylneuraminic acid synthetase [bacterium C-53]|nr:acetylneuraminic acid synthetase [Lachnospiraceae bacterium]NBI01587.1 acetylneuraminic acid synthetase [Lachnospiraceae bacterium]RKJ12887.1 acetylneuraminic acid synthetase [bacterium C-53]